MRRLRLDRVMWVFAALFLLFGLPLFFVEDKSWQKALLGLSTLSLGGFALAMAGDGVLKGEIKFNLSLIKRRDQPVVFWLTVALVTAAGIATIITGIWALFFKVW